MIAFVGSVFSPWYAWAGRKDPDDHVSINVAIYRPEGNRWAMTERGRRDARRTGHGFEVGRSAMRWDGGNLVVDFEETALPWASGPLWPEPLQGRLRLSPSWIGGDEIALDAAGRHRWHPVAPAGRISVEIGGRRPLRWDGHGYHDMNHGDEPLEQAFAHWDWARGRIGDDALVLYDARERSGRETLLAHRITGPDSHDVVQVPPRTSLGRGFWGVPRSVRAAQARLLRRLEDGPFYTRSLLQAGSGGADITMIHESFSGTRFSSPVVKAMLPFRMPRRASR